jgi:hypothetical protein
MLKRLSHKLSKNQPSSSIKKTLEIWDCKAYYKVRDKFNGARYPNKKRNFMFGW